jgi:hypothetical protein
MRTCAWRRRVTILLAACILVAGIAPWHLQRGVITAPTAVAAGWPTDAPAELPTEAATVLIATVAPKRADSNASGLAQPPMNRCTALHPPDCGPELCNGSFLVIVSRAAEELEWTRTLPVPYRIVQKANENHTLPRHHPVHARLVPNTAFEASSYLTFIVDEYDNLPEVLVFLHAHESSWHQTGKIGDHLCAQLRAFVDGRPAYTSVNSFTIDSFPEHPQELRTRMIVASGMWDAVLAPTFGEVEALTTFEADSGPMCCAQFIVTRGTVQRLPREFYVRWLAWLLRTGDELQAHSVACKSEYRPSAIEQPTPCVTACTYALAEQLGYGSGTMACYITEDLAWHSACQPSLQCAPDFYLSRFAEWVWEFVFAAKTLRRDI